MNTITTSPDKIVHRCVAVEFLGKGMSTADIALVRGVSLSSVKSWKRAFRLGGAAALANFAPDDVDQLYNAVVNAIGDVQLRPPLMQSFFHTTKLRL